MSEYEGGMHLLYGVCLLCQVAILWVLSRRAQWNPVRVRVPESTFYELG